MMVCHHQLSDELQSVEEDLEETKKSRDHWNEQAEEYKDMSNQLEDDYQEMHDAYDNIFDEVVQLRKLKKKHDWFLQHLTEDDKNLLDTFEAIDHGKKV